MIAGFGDRERPRRIYRWHRLTPPSDGDLTNDLTCAFIKAAAEQLGKLLAFHVHFMPGRFRTDRASKPNFNFKHALQLTGQQDDREDPAGRCTVTTPSTHGEVSVEQKKKACTRVACFSEKQLRACQTSARDSTQRFAQQHRPCKSHGPAKASSKRAWLFSLRQGADFRR